MKMLRFCLIMMWIAAAVTAMAQGRGVAEGRLVNRTNPAILAGNTEIEVLLLSGGMDIIKTAVTDARGTFRIEGLPDAMPLMLRAVYKGVNYQGHLRFDADGKARIDIDVYEPTASMADIRVETANIAFQLEGKRLHAVETFVVVNSADPPRVYANPEGNFRVSKAPGILEPPLFRITAPGSEMPLTQSALESADGENYYSLYPLRPGGTIFEVHQTLPYTDGKYVYRKKFFQDIPEFPVGVIPLDMTLSGGGIKKTEDYAAENFAVYAAGAVRAGDETTWTFTGGTPVAATEHDHESGETTIMIRNGAVGRNAPAIGSAILAFFVLALILALKRPAPMPETESRTPGEKP
jgi:hypothetical protein